MLLKELEAALRTVLNDVEVAPHNDPLFPQAVNLYIGKTLENLSKKYKDPATKVVKEKLASELATIGQHTLLTTSELLFSAKVTAPRETFDKDAFIKALVLKYDMNAVELYTLAGTSVKQSAPVVTMSLELNS